MSRSPIIGERAKRARHSLVCSIENRGYIYIMYSTCNFCSYNPVKKAERNFEIAARTVYVVLRRALQLRSKSRFPGNISVLEFFSIESSLKAISSDYGSNKERNRSLRNEKLKANRAS